MNEYSVVWFLFYPYKSPKRLAVTLKFTDGQQAENYGRECVKMFNTLKPDNTRLSFDHVQFVRREG
jgi:hypothetical protein